MAVKFGVLGEKVWLGPVGTGQGMLLNWGFAPCPWDSHQPLHVRALVPSPSLLLLQHPSGEGFIGGPAPHVLLGFPGHPLL